MLRFPPSSKPIRLLPFVLLFPSIVAPLAAAPGPMELFSATAAAYSTQTSNDAYPIGNGRLAAMIYGGVAQETVQFNEDTVWAGTVHDYSHDNAASFLPAIRNYVWNKQGTNAYDLVAKANFMSVPLRQSPYVPTANLRLDFPHSSVTGYRRSLDLEKAVARVQYVAGGVTYTREFFASYPDQAIVARITASQPGALNFSYTFDSRHTAVTVSASGTDLAIDGKVNKDTPNANRQQTSDVRFCAKIKVTADGGTVTPGGNRITIAGATSATLVLAVASNFKRYNDLTGDPVAKVDAILAAAGPKSHAELLAAHLADYEPLFKRVELDLNATNQSALATDARIQLLKNAATGYSGTAQHAPTAAAMAKDLQFVALNFQMARYLYIAGSRPGSQPLNLQGKWNNELDPAWESKMTLNINQEMNYWGAEVMNLPECHLPMVELVRDLSETGAVVAQKHYGAGGWVVHHNTDLWRGAAPINGADGIWPTGAAWLCQHLWWHYLYTGDKTYLADAYPLMKGAARYFTDSLVADTRPGRFPYLMTNPTHSPEQPDPSLGDNGSMVPGTTMDNQLIRELFTNVIKAGEILGTDPDFRSLLAEKRALLPPDKIGSKGQLQEWLDDVDVPNTHRHLSPLFGMFPADQISPVYDPALAAGVRTHLTWKGNETNNTSWSQAWKMCLWNTLFEGNTGFTILANLMRTSHSNNLTFSIKGGGSPENQIDGNLGSGMGIAMFFLQNTRGEIQLLPALPPQIPKGSVKGLRSPGAFTVGIAWEAGKLTRATIHSDLGNPCAIRVAGPVHVKKGGVVIPLTSKVANLYEFATTAGADYEILAGEAPLPAPDSDGDGLPDACETNTRVFVSATDTGSSPYSIDTDGDSLADGEEVNTLGTNPNKADTDGDLLDDRLEIALHPLGFNPRVPATYPWRQLLDSNAPALGLFTRDQLLQAETGSQLLTPPDEMARFPLPINLAESEGLDRWSNMALETGVTITRDGSTFHFNLPGGQGSAFYRFAVSGIFMPPGPPPTPMDPTDSDHDGIPDPAETNLAPMGFVVGTDSSPLRESLYGIASSLGYETAASVRGISIKGPSKFRSTGNAVTFDLEVTVENQDGLWEPVPLEATDVSLHGDTLLLKVTTDPVVKYLRLTGASQSGGDR